MGFPTKNDHFGVFWGYHHFRKPPCVYVRGHVLQISGLGDVFAGSVSKSNHDTGLLKVRCSLQNGNALTICLHVQEGRPLKRGAHTQIHQKPSYTILYSFMYCHIL